MKYFVEAQPSTSNGKISKEIDIPECKNDVGELVVIVKELCKDIVSYSLVVHVTSIPQDVSAKITDTELWLHADHRKPGILVGLMTPKGKKTQVDGGINTATRPQFKILLDALLSAKKVVRETREQIFNDAKPKEPTIPDGMVRVTFSGSKLDGWVQIYSDGKGHEFDSPKIEGEEHGIAWMTLENYQAALITLQAEQQETKDKAIRRLENIVKQGESLKSEDRLLTYVEQKQKAREYDNVFNEGGDGYNPYRDIISLEEYNDAKNQLTTK